MYCLMRNFDRQLNIERYPKVFFPDMYVMEGGYSQFWQKYMKQPNNNEVIEVPSQNIQNNDKCTIGYIPQSIKLDKLY